MKKHHTAYFQVRWLAAGLFVTSLFGLVFGSLSQALPVQAADQVTLSGRVYNLSTGAGYAGVNLSLCSAGTAVTGANGNWQVTVDNGTYYCVRLAGGVPNAPSGPMVRNNPEVGVKTSYENQQAGVNCYHNPACPADQQPWDRPIDGGLDFVYSNEPPVAPVAAATPVPVVVATPAPPAVLGAPVDFVVKASADNDHTANLSWTPVGDVAGRTYKIERSLDRNSWEVLADSLTDPSYQDPKAVAGVHYYYRLSVVTPAGASDFALADLVMGNVLAATSPPDGVYTSADGLAKATVRAGTISAGATCSVNILDRPASGGSKATKAGPYQLQCKDTMNAAVTQFNRPVSWQFKLADQLRGYQSPQVAQKTDGGETEILTGALYDAKSGLLTVDAPGKATVSVIAARVDYGWVAYAAIGGLVVLVAVVLAFIPFRSQRKMSYQEYLRAKYYNL